MQVILDKQLYDSLWDKVYLDYKFDLNAEEWLVLPQPCKKYALSVLWTEEQEKLINSFFKRLCPEKMYALDWQHDCMIFSPDEDIPLDYFYYDAERDCNVYFPSYYPNGDYYFFASSDWKYGLFGHPWRREIYVTGKELIMEFENNKERLQIADIR